MLIPYFTPLSRLTTQRNFSIIAHIDHGKSTLANRFVQLASGGRSQAKKPLFDSMDLERERGVTIKLKPVTFHHHDVTFNLIDTPGHVDFSYEVSRSLAAVEGALLVVDASQGIQAQTLAHFGVARELGVTIVPVVNKIDLPSVDVNGVAETLADLVGCSVDEVLRVSAKTGQGVAELLTAIVERIPSPKTSGRASSRGLIFDALFDDYRGVIAYVRMKDGVLKPADHITLLGTKMTTELLAVGTFAPDGGEQPQLSAGAIGYLVTGLKEITAVRVGDTVSRAGETVTSLPGYRVPQPMVFASLFPQEGGDVERLRSALGKLCLTDSSLFVEPERSSALGFGFRCGFLGLFHLEIIDERLRREYGQELVVTVPSVAYRITMTDGEKRTIHTALEFPDTTNVAEVEEPWIALRCVLPPSALGVVMQLIAERRGVVGKTENLTRSVTYERVILHAELPLSTMLTNFYDLLKSRTSGFASFAYDLLDFRTADIIRLDILVAGERIDALATMVVRSEAERLGRGTLEALKETLPREQFEIRLQAAIAGKIIASERIPPLRKDVTAKLYGGDVTRKRKLLEKQKRGKKRMRHAGRVRVPPAAFLAVLKRDSHRVQ